jgi:hypothetical protein
MIYEHGKCHLKPSVEEIQLTGGFKDQEYCRSSVCISDSSDGKGIIATSLEAVASTEEFEGDFHGAGLIANLNSYT